MDKKTMELTPGMTPLRGVADLPGPAGRPLFGNIGAIRARPIHQVLEQWAGEYGALYRFRIMRRQLVATADRELIAMLLRERPDVIRRPIRSSDMLDEIGMRGLFTAEGEDWRRQRKLVMRALTPEVIHNFFPTLAAMTDRLRLRWQRAIDAGQPVDLARDLKAYTLDVTIGLAMGQDINTLEREEHPLQRDIEFLFKLVARRLTSPLTYWRVPVLRRAQDHEATAASARIQQAISGFIAEARQRIAANPQLRAKPSNMLEALIVARDEPDSGFTDAEVIGNAITMVFAGEDTTSNSMVWLLDFLAVEPAAMVRMAQEAQQVLGARAVLDDYRLLDRLEYVDAATREAMRLKPVAPFLTVEPTQDVVLGDLAVPAGTVIFLLLRQSSARDSEVAQPTQFLPERWLEDGQRRGDDPGRKLFPFGAGPRFCPGRYLAMAEIKMVMSMLVRHFTLERVPDAAPARECFTFTMTPDALPVRLVSLVHN